MMTIRKVMKPPVAGLAILCMILGMATFAFAVPINELLRIQSNRTITSKCCINLGESVSVTEPAEVVPVIVTWSTDYQTANFAYFHAELSVNGHPCQSFGPALIDSFDSHGAFASVSFQWVVLPSDGLIHGRNTITLCGGTDGGAQSITLGFRTLAVTISE